MPKLKTDPKDYDIREFKFEHHNWTDPGAEHSLQVITDHLSGSHPAIRQADVEEKVEERTATKVVDGEEQEVTQRVLVVTFVKKAKTKG